MGKPTERVVVYIDGYNLYRGLCDAGLRSSRWLNLVSMCDEIIGERSLSNVRYFTARVLDDPQRLARQNLYIDALNAHGGIEIEFGKYKKKKAKCFSCKTSWRTYEEKKTDTRIAVRVVEDAFDNRFDVALIISGDSDMIPPIELLQERFPEKSVIVVFPPRRRNGELASRVGNSNSYSLKPETVESHRFPSTVTTSSGHDLNAPTGWLPS